ncbi:MAG: 50S ribosome-binding GTPase [Bacteroidales bacterium]|nr:50S ribosome-binding GTPase [Bacteroidales bacterium]
MTEPYQISFFGATNSGKSTLVNAIAGQKVSLVSDRPGTTTDPVRKRIELPEIGPCVLVDTAGYGDGGELGSERERLTRQVIDSTDVAVLLLSGNPEDAKWQKELDERDVPVVAVEDRNVEFGALIKRIAAVLPKVEERFLTGRLVHHGSVVVLVMPQDSEAPAGRIILPQVRVIRELLDRRCIPVCCTPDKLTEAMKTNPDLVITDSQVFGLVNAAIPPEMPLTSFSILLAAEKGDIGVMTEGAKAIGGLKDGSKVLVAEACTHVPNSEDIGRVKIPAMLRKKADIEVKVSAGNDFPDDLSAYSLIIHCGGCTVNSQLVRSRIRKARLSGVPITNYGLALAYMQGILDRVSLP